MGESLSGPEDKKIEFDQIAAAYKEYAANLASGGGGVAGMAAYDLMQQWWSQQLSEVAKGHKTLAEAALEKMTILEQAGFHQPLTIYDDIQEARKWAAGIPKDESTATLRESFAKVIKGLRNQARVANENHGIADTALRSRIREDAREFSPAPSINFVRRIKGGPNVVVDISWRFKDFSNFQQPYLEEDFPTVTKFEALQAAKNEGMDDPFLDLLNRFKEFLTKKGMQDIKIVDVSSVSDSPSIADQEGAMFITLTGKLSE